MKTPNNFVCGKASVSFGFTIHSIVSESVLDELYKNQPEDVYIYRVNSTCVELYEDAMYKNFICSYTYDPVYDVYKTNMTEKPDYVCWIKQIYGMPTDNETMSITTPDMLHFMDQLAKSN